jgi:hypothetical protein
MTTLNDIRKYAASAGVEFDANRDGRQWSVNCWSPDGKNWKNHGTHFLALSADGFYSTPNWSDVLSELKTEVAGGFEDCSDPDCDNCNGY